WRRAAGHVAWNAHTNQRKETVMEHAQLVVHRGGIRVPREALRTIETPPATATWKPLPHHVPRPRRLPPRPRRLLPLAAAQPRRLPSPGPAAHGERTDASAGTRGKAAGRRRGGQAVEKAV